VPEVQRYAHLCQIATTPAAFVAALDAALADGSPPREPRDPRR